MNSGFSHPRAKLSTDLVSVVSDPFHLGSLDLVSHSLLPPTQSRWRAFSKHCFSDGLVFSPQKDPSRSYRLMPGHPFTVF